MIKTILRYAFMLVAVAAIITACKKDDEGTTSNSGQIPTGVGTFTVTGTDSEGNPYDESFTLTRGAQVFYGDTKYPSDAMNVTLTFNEPDEPDMLLFEMFFDSTEKLKNGTYHYVAPDNADAYRIFTFSWGRFSDESYIDGGIGIRKAVSGTITVSVVSETYNISVNCILEGGATLTGSFQGKLAYTYDVE